MKSEQQRIKFHYLAPPFYLPKRNKLKKFILEKFKTEGKMVEAINYIFCTDKYLLPMNRKYLQHNTLTDIITFETSPKNQPLLADIFISVERVKDNAQKFCVPFSTELLRVIFHGALHLSDYNDKTPKQVHKMRLKEQQYIDEFAISRGT